jgi:uncharacterized protein
MEFEWDEEKNRSNIESRKLDFADSVEVFQNLVSLEEDTRVDYGEKRIVGYGFVGHRLMVVVYTERDPDIIRIISLRKANKREQKMYNIFERNEVKN